MSQPDNSKLATASSPIRMRVQGMDCAKDAAEIERAARSAGVAEGDVKVSAATHIMTLWIADGDLPKVRPALDATGYGFEKIEVTAVLTAWENGGDIDADIEDGK